MFKVYGRLGHFFLWTFLTANLWAASAVLAQLAAPAAPASGSSGGGGFFTQTTGLLLMFAIFFFLIIWPQQRKAKKQAAFLASLERGDDVVTNSGIFGKIVGIADRVVTLEIAPNVKIRVDRQTISSKDSGTSSEPKAAAQS
jgi:preprotein translocase subunit YajC